MTGQDIAIVSGCDRIRYASYVGQQLYARRHGFGYHLELAPFDGFSGYWHKVAALRAHLADHDWVVWFDDDAFVTDLDSTFLRDALEDAERAGAWLAIAPSCDDELNGAWAAYNTGVFALRNGPHAHALLDAMSAAPMADIEAWWDSDRLGVFTHGDQDALVWFVESSSLESSVHWVDPLGWNARPWHFSGSIADPPVCHFPGHPDKSLAIAELARRLGTDETLVRPRGHTKKYDGVHAQVPSIGPVAEQLRRTSIIFRRFVRRVRRKAGWIRANRSWS
ncbi:galactosyl transferase GMA12/MNN10 family protein [Nocardioides alpinus]|uniref:Galactosyl transferase GMA12/MNN10 family protein n=1 Tax=Nocardioides alpinus TaxID=748909 RepID=A0A1I0W5F2_9ACTN|nr:hypothetical protein [Nocardioides alpinus]PKH37656.1 hypothetical protein CXG46_19720 [Nocardioides alpinus]SFA83096.1 galactosyl transferase GMA12/MNN10 family protein [Nocardioides alpinus]